jgi:hypothetical protein
MPELPPETLTWLRQSATVKGSTYSQVLLHLLDRVGDLAAAQLEQADSTRFCVEALANRLEALEAAQQHDTLLIGGPQDKLDRLIALDSGDDAPAPEADR